MQTFSHAPRAAVTIEAAPTPKTLGTLEPGKQADLVVWDADNLDQLIYRYGTNRAAAVFKRGVRMTGKENLWNA